MKFFLREGGRFGVDTERIAVAGRLLIAEILSKMLLLLLLLLLSSSSSSSPAVGRCGYEIKGPSCLEPQELSLVPLFFVFSDSSTFCLYDLLNCIFIQTFFNPPYVCTVHGVSNIGRGS
jgi:hypothetical protein